MTDTLRTLLEQMTHDGSPVESYPAKLKPISVQHPHTIRALPSPQGEDLGRFNCVMYALGLVGYMERPCSFLGRFYADTVFFNSLIQQQGLSPCVEKKGALVVWTSAGATKHVGIMVDRGRAASKWGIGYVYEHGVLEVPISFGEPRTFYEAVGSEDAIEHLERCYNSR